MIEANPRSAPRLLVLDDDPVMREIIAILAERDGFETRMTGSAREFFSEFHQWRPTHITIDLVMPGEDGIQILRELETAACHAAIVIISSMNLKVLESAKRVAIERGLNICGVLNKPFKHDALREMLKNALPAIKRERIINPHTGGLNISSEAFREALEEDEFVLYFQPKVNLLSGKIIGIEVLVRWQHPLLGLVTPDLFISNIENLGLIHLLTQRVIEKSLSWFASANLSDSISLAINLSALDLSKLALADMIYAQSTSRGVAPERIVLELTETSAMNYPEASLATLTRLRIKGFGLAIDDFGTGYSSMVLLAQLPFSSMKIDKSFVMSMEHSSESKKIVGSIISLGHALDLSIVAEGVETFAAARMLRDLACDTAQGYKIAKPMTSKDLLPWLAAWDANSFNMALDNAVK
jgi:EAL domain-containing protein (putative c-di-GMP-specific phosphodiesterase class I)/CheY-like chemotaxis protein